MGGSGGGASGAVSHSVYLEWVHTDWLDRNHADAIVSSITEVMNSALGNSPWTSLAAYDPDADIAAFEAELAVFAALLAGLADTTDWAALQTQAVTSIGTPTPVVIADIIIDDVVIEDIEGLEDIVIGDVALVDAVGPVDIVIADAVVVPDTPLITDAEIIVDTAALADQIDDEITAKVLPRFRRGMQDINAVVSSAFPIGEAIIEAFRDREVAKHASTMRLNLVNKNAEIGIANRSKDVQIRLANVDKNKAVGIANLNKAVDIVKINLSKNISIPQLNITKAVDLAKVNIGKNSEFIKINLTKAVEVAKINITKNMSVADLNVRTLSDYEKMYLDGTGQMASMMARRIAWEESLSRMTVESGRIKIVAKKEQFDEDSRIDEQDAKWDLEVFAHGGNLLAAIGGGVAVPNLAGKNKTASAIGGAMSGAVAGAMYGASEGSVVSPGYGTAIGAVLGAAVGLLGAS